MDPQADLEGSLLDLEERFWYGDAMTYVETLTDTALMVFAEPIGPLT